MNSTTIPTRQPILDRLVTAFVTFVSAPASAKPLAVLRIGLAGLLLVQALALGGVVTELYGPRGIIPWSIVHDQAVQGMPRLSWVVDALASHGVSADTCVRGVYLVYVGSLAGLLLGWHTRLSALVAWLTHLALMTSGNASIYGVDQFALIALFYCVCLPVGDALSADQTLGRVSGAPSPGARLGLRLLQLHMCVVYLSSGIEKASGEQWWNGEAIWRALLCPTSALFDFGWLAWAPWLAVVLCWGTLAVELGYAFLIWPRRTRKLMLLATVGMHAGIALSMGLVMFSAVMIVLNLAAFGFSPEPVEVANGNAMPVGERGT
jgi:hypothetical protein